MKSLDRRLVVSMAIGDYFTDLMALTVPGQHAYAQKVGADYLVLQDSVIAASSPFYEIFQLYDLFEDYDRILYVDLDVLIRGDCPDLFNQIPRDLLGVFFESRFVDRSNEIKKIQTLWPPINWSGDYFNNGVMVLSRLHQGLFKVDYEYPNDLAFFDQTLINYLAVASNTKVYDIGLGFNYMSVLLGRGRLGRLLLNDICRGIILIPGLYKVRPESQNAFVVHFAGYAAQAKLRLIRQILAAWEEGRGGSIGPSHQRLNRVFHGLLPKAVEGVSVHSDRMTHTLLRLCDGTRTADELLNLIYEIFPDQSKDVLWRELQLNLNTLIHTAALSCVNQAS